MRIISILILSLLISLNGICTTYYVSVATGNDANNGLTSSTAWKTLTKVNSFTFAAGDNILFACNDIFTGSLTLSTSGTSLNRITYGSFGSGSKPTISGFTLASSWTDNGSNIWETSSAISPLATCNILSINGTNTAKGRTPNTGYWLLQSSTATSLTDNVHLNAGTLNWTGAEAVVRVLMYVIKRTTVTSASGATINYGNIGAAETANYGYFLQNDLRNLDLQNEWMFNSSTRKISIYSTSNPALLNINVPTVSNGIVMNGKNFITIDNLHITGYNSTGILFNGVSGQQSAVIIQNCTIDYCGEDGVYAYPNSPSLRLINNTVNQCNNRGLDAGSSSSVIITGNTVLNIGMLAGMMGSSDDAATGIISNGDNANINYNDVEFSGYCNIRCDGNSINVIGNKLNNATSQKDDGANLYMYPAVLGNVPQNLLTRTVRDNIITNTISAPAGSPFGRQGALAYFDGQSPNINFYHNTLGNDNSILTGRYGAFLNGGNSIKLDSNIIYNVDYSYYSKKIGGAMYGCTLTNNQLVVFNNNSDAACGNEKYAITVFPDSSNMPVTWVSSNNVIANPRNQTAGWIFRNFCSGTCSVCNTLGQWQSATSKDAGSASSPKIVNSIDSILFLRNATAGSVTTALGQNYVDMKNVAYAGSITLAPYSGAVLIRNGGILNTPPTCSAGSAATITLPVSSVALVATAASTMGGSIISYLWTKDSGTGSTITSPSSASTTATGLSAGSYIYRILVTDNNGLTCTTTKNITVNPQPVTPTVTGTATPSTITLPTSSTNLTSTASGGTITTYGWRILSGIGGSITSTSSQNTSITGLVAGNYSVEIEVTNNFSLKNRDTVSIIVNPAPVAPVANAGLDATITLPINFCALNGSASTSGSSPLQTISWVKLTGGSAGITNASQLVTTATGLVASVYTFELTITNQNLLSDKDTVQITVLAAPVLSPPIVTVGANFTASLPFNTITITSAVVVPSGILSSLTWTQITGASATITTPNALISTVSGITTAGTYQFVMTAVSSVALTGKDTLTIQVTETTIGTGIRYFNAVLYNKTKAKLNWTSENVSKNSRYFEVQIKGKNGFQPLFEVTPVVGKKEYEFISGVLPKGVSTFRIYPLDKVGNCIPTAAMDVKKN